MTDADRFEAFVREFQDMVFGTAVRLLGNPTDAEDIALLYREVGYHTVEEGVALVERSYPGRPIAKVQFLLEEILQSLDAE